MKKAIKLIFKILKSICVIVSSIIIFLLLILVIWVIFKIYFKIWAWFGIEDKALVIVLSIIINIAIFLFGVMIS